jgi:hypothetical protein
MTDLSDERQELKAFRRQALLHSQNVRAPLNQSTFAIVVGDEVFVYVLGELVMKRWLRTGVSATFHVAPAGVRWSR